MRSAERVVPDVAECTRCRTSKHAAGCSVGSQLRNRCEPSEEPVGVSLDTKGKRAGSPIGAADVDILVQAAVFVAWSPWQPPAPVGDAGQSPSTDGIVRQSVGTAHILLPLAERQLIEDVRYPHVIAVHVHGAIGYLGIDGEIVAVIESRAGEGIMRHELKSLGDSLFDFKLQRIVIAVRIHAKI